MLRLTTLQEDVRRLVEHGDLEMGHARALLAYCDLDWDPQCLDFHRNPRPVVTASMTQVRKPVYASSVGRWRRYADHLGPLLKALGERADAYPAHSAGKDGGDRFE